VTAQPAGPRPSPVPVTERARKSPQAGTAPAGQYRPLLTEDPPLPCAQISARHGILAGSIGPSRSRCRCRPHRRRSRTRDKGAARASRDAMTTVHDAPTDARTTPGPSLAKSRFRPCAPTRGPGANALISAECRSGKSGHQNSNDWPMVQPSRFGVMFRCAGLRRRMSSPCVTDISREPDTQGLVPVATTCRRRGQDDTRRQRRMYGFVGLC
jgi:hypothetical protein